ncbi:hypothetical protein PVAND_013995 [Polypedilum vanderplanki]|uniref:Daxx histone-binding domain-containing protein n=1 Tax=Polypedilum vanderplanki TaxID=319348 RepID=A0A9J6CSX4_POLVA|nr:hypothetical protein PVAND_013995 [Polypedilum vanderplanki]
MDPTIIILDSDDEDNANQNTETNSTDKIQAVSSNKRPNTTTNGNNDTSPPEKIRRIQPQKIGEVSKAIERSSSNDDEKKNSTNLTTSQDTNDTQEENNAGPSKQKEKQENEITKELKGFIKACKQIEPNDDMKKIIKSKLLKHYHLVHPEYAISKFFRKMLEDSALAILKDPRSVYSKLQDIINELKSRKKTNSIVPVVTENEASTSQQSENGIEIKTTGDEKKDKYLKKLNKGLAQLRKKIEALEEEEVDWDDDKSAYMRKVLCEKKAVEIYEKICEITGESTHAHRKVKQPIKFNKTDFKEFNRKLTKKINKENGFPSYYDVYRLLDFCNKEYKYNLQKEKLKLIAEQAFVDVGLQLKKRRTSDLYESATHWANGKEKDPAKYDNELKSKLEKNRQHYKKKTEQVLEYYVQKQLNGDLGIDSEENEEDDDIDDIKSEQQPCTSKDLRICDTVINEDLKSIPTKLVSIIDVKAEQFISEDDFEMLNGDDTKLPHSKIDVSMPL